MAKNIECMLSQLDLFTKKPMQSNILSTEEISYKPVTAITNNSVIEFTSLGHGDTYRDLSSIRLRLLVKHKKSSTESYDEAVPAVKDVGGTITKPAEEAKGGSLVNNVLHSLFKQCTIWYSNFTSG